MQYEAKFQKDVFIDIDKIILKCVGKCKGIWIAKTTLKRKKKVGGTQLLRLRL